jgi:hypothetical protein
MDPEVLLFNRLWWLLCQERDALNSDLCVVDAIIEVVASCACCEEHYHKGQHKQHPP